MLTLNERWIGVLARPDSEPICGRPLRLALRLSLCSWRTLRTSGWPLEAEIKGLPGQVAAEGRLTLNDGALHYAIVAPGGLTLAGTRSLSLRGFPPPFTIMTATIRQGAELRARATLRFDVRTELRRMLPRNEAHRL